MNGKFSFCLGGVVSCGQCVPNDMLNATEKANVDTILNYEKECRRTAGEDPAGGYGIAGRAELLPDDRLDEQPRQFCGKPSGGRILCQCDEDRRLG